MHTNPQPNKPHTIMNTTTTTDTPRNSVMTIHPYIYHDQWVFDDETRGLNKEAFVAGADNIMDLLYMSAHGATEAMIPAGAQFSIRFSASSFKGYQYRFDQTDFNHDEGHPWHEYTEHHHGIKGWLCPSLLDFFENAPAHIYVEAQPHRSGRFVDLSVADDILSE